MEKLTVVNYFEKSIDEVLKSGYNNTIELKKGQKDVQHNTTQHNTTQHNTTQHNTILKQTNIEVIKD